MKKVICAFCMFFCFTMRLYAQDSLVTELSKAYVKTFIAQKGSFQGEGWNEILARVEESNYILVGEDHLMNEVPQFCSALVSHVRFDNFFCEIDPFSAEIIETKIKRLPGPQLENFVSDYGNTFSFFAMKPELDLLKQIISQQTKIFGIDQILIVADRLICSQLRQRTKNAVAASVYRQIEDESKSHFQHFLADHTKPFYMLTPKFEEQLEKLSKLDLSEEEMKVIDRLKLTAKIYKQQNHQLRVQLIKSQLMEKYKAWETKKSLFKYGAVHTPKGQSLRDIYDIGNLINNVADSRFQKSLHIMIVAKSGFQASPFKGFPDAPIDLESDDLKALKPLFEVENGEHWQCFDIAALKKELSKSKIVISNKKLGQVLEGYDLLVVIPVGTPAKFAF